MRWLTYIIDILVLSFMVLAFYRISVQDSDKTIQKKQETTASSHDKLDKLNEMFDE